MWFLLQCGDTMGANQYKVKAQRENVTQHVKADESQTHILLTKNT